MAGKKTTIRNIARRAGVCPMTVSLALRGQRGVSASTRQRIQALAREMNYEHDPLVSRLMSRLPKDRRGGTPVLALVTDYECPYQNLAHQRDVSSMAGAEAQARLLGYRLQEFRISGEITGKRLSEILHNRGIEGVLIGPLQRAQTRLDLDWSRFASVALGYTLNQPVLDRVSNNHFQGIMEAMQQLYQRGYRRVGLMTTADHDRRVRHAWTAGYLLSCRQLGMRHPLPKFNAAPSLNTLRKWFDRYRPDVVLGDSSLTAWAESEWLRSTVDYASLHIHPQREQGISGIDQNWHQLGQVAVDMLVSRIHSTATGIPCYPVITMGEGTWVNGRTTRRVAAAET